MHEVFRQLTTLQTEIEEDPLLVDSERVALDVPIGELKALVNKDENFWVAVEAAQESFDDQEFSDAVLALDKVELKARTDHAKRQWTRLRWKSHFHGHAAPAGEALADLREYDRAYRTVLKTSREAARRKATSSGAPRSEVDLASAQETYDEQLTTMQTLLGEANTAYDEYTAKLKEQYETDKAKFVAAKALLPSLKGDPSTESDYEAPSNESQLNQNLDGGLAKVGARLALLAYETTYKLDFATEDSETWVARIEEAKKLVAMHAKTDGQIATSLALELETWLSPVNLQDKTLRLEAEVVVWIESEVKKRRAAVDKQNAEVEAAKKNGKKVNKIALDILAEDKKYLSALDADLTLLKANHPKNTVFREVRLKGEMKPTPWLRGLFRLRDPKEGRYDFLAYPVSGVPAKPQTLRKGKFSLETPDHRRPLCFDLLEDYSVALKALKSNNAWKKQADWNAFHDVVGECDTQLKAYKISGGLVYGTAAEKALDFESDATKARIVKENWKSIKQVFDEAKAIEGDDKADSD